MGGGMEESRNQIPAEAKEGDDSGLHKADIVHAGAKDTEQ